LRLFTSRYGSVQDFPVAATPRRAPKGHYGTVSLSPVVSLFDRASRRLEPVVNDVPLCFEDMDLNHGLVLYETDLPPVVGKSAELPLVVGSLRDRATVFLNHVRISTDGFLANDALSLSPRHCSQARSGTMVRGNATMDLSIPAGNKHKLSILVENQGRINDKRFLADRKVHDYIITTDIIRAYKRACYPVEDFSFPGDFVERNTRKTCLGPVDDDRISVERNVVVRFRKRPTERPTAGVLPRRFRRATK